jgi:acyl carrier protein
MSVQSDIIDQFRRVAREQGRAIAELNDQTSLLECGLDSLCFAIVVTRLEDQFGVDPFSSESTLFPVTFGEFVQLYEACAAK